MRLLTAFLVPLLATSALAASLRDHADLVQSRPDGVQLLVVGSKYLSFSRANPVVVDPQFLQEYGAQGYLHVHFNPNGDNSYTSSSSQYIASLRNASVCGSEGDVWDGEGRLFRANTWVKHPFSKLEAWRKDAEEHGVRRYQRLATSVHRVSFMYFHFMTETLPRIAKFAPLLKADPELKLLTYDNSFVRTWTQKLGIDQDQLVAFDPLFAYHADELLITNPVEIARTPREDLQQLLSLLDLPPPLPASERTDIVYVSRRLATERKQTNEDALLEALQAEAAAHGLRLVVHDGNPGLTPEDTVDMFRRAQVVMGPNGAGLAHMLFAAPGTALVELMFINNTGMDLWHLTAALKQSYYMVPLPRSYWLDPGSDVPIEQAVATLRLALAQQSGARPRCPAGSAPGANGACESCPPGTFSTGFDPQCMTCSPGWVAERTGSGSCRVCPTSAFSTAPTACSACPAGTLAAMPGSTAPQQCLDPAGLEEVKQAWMPIEQVVAKVSAYFQAIVTRRRSMAEARFDALPGALKDRILSELDACTGYYTYSAYGCTKPPGPSRPPPPPGGMQNLQTYALSLRALRNGALTSCSVYLIDPKNPQDATPLGVALNSTGYLKTTVQAPVDAVLLQLVNCTEPRSNTSGRITGNAFAPLSSSGALTAVLSPLAVIASAGPQPPKGGANQTSPGSAPPPPMQGADFAERYVNVSRALGIPVAAYGSAMGLATFDYEAATFNATDMTLVTRGALVYATQLMIGGYVEIFASFVAALPQPAAANSSTTVVGPTPRYSDAFSKTCSSVRDGVSTSTLINPPFTLATIFSNRNISLTILDKVLPALAGNTSTGRRLLDATPTYGFTGTAVEGRVVALVEAVTSSIALEADSLDRLANAVQAGDALLASDLYNMLVVFNKIAAAQGLIAAAAVNMAAGNLTEAAFRARYTGNPLAELVYGQVVSIPGLRAADNVAEDSYNTGAVIGGAIGGFFGVAILVLIIVLVVKIRRDAAHVQPKATEAAAPAAAAEPA